MTAIYCFREACTYNLKCICQATDIIVGKDMECKTGEEQ